MAAKRINREKLRRMRRAIKQKTLIEGRYLGTSEGETCALGALALEAGLESNIIKKRNGVGIFSRPDISGVISQEFGLTLTEQGMLQDANDTARVIVRGHRAPAPPEVRMKQVLDKLYYIYLNQR